MRHQDLRQLLYCGFFSYELMYSGKRILMIGGALSQCQWKSDGFIPENEDI